MSVRDLISETKRRMIARYPRFGGEVASANILFNSNLPCHTAATDGQDIYFDPAYFEGLSEDDRVFLIAHEIMHIKFQHAFRLVSRDGKMKDFDTWNDATDAIINANLQRDGFAIKEGYINRPEALNYSADEFYQILLKEKQQQAEQGQQGQGQQGQEGKSSQEQGQGQESQKGQEGQKDQEGQQGQEQQEGKESQEGQQAQQDEKEKQDQQGQEEGKQDQQGQSGQEKKDQEGQSGKPQQGNNGESGKQTTGKRQHHGDDHSLWQKAFQERMEEAQNGHKSAKNHKNDQEDSQNESDENAESENQPEKDKNNFSDDSNGDNNKNNSNEDIFNADDQDDDEYSFDEKKEFEQNREMRREIAKKYMDKLKNGEFLKTGEKIKLGNVGEAKSVIDWKLLLRREVEKTETIWSQRRSVAENNFAYRLDENDIDDEAETEVMIDVSGSVSLSMVKSFLRQLKPLLKQSKLKVGCFNEKFWGMTEIKTERDIDKFEIPNQARGNAAWTEDWDLAVRSFSKKREVNKIVFTDGLPQPGTMPKQDLKGTNVIWIVYENKNFSPCCGTVILVNKKEFNRPPQNMEKQREF